MRMGYKVLVIDDDPSICRVLSPVLRSEGYEVRTARDGFEGIKVIKEAKIDLVLLDQRMLGIDGLETLRRIKMMSPETVVIIMTAYGTIESVVEAMKNGAYDYLTKPFDNERLKLLLSKALEHKKVVSENIALKRQIGEGKIVGRSKAIRDILALLPQISESDWNVLIEGETGTGKGVIARMIHEMSPRRDGPFVAVSCAAIPETLLEAELFGHTKGAFTGAISAREGKVEAAEGGTLFLDEIGEIGPMVQVKLLRLVEEKCFERIGSNKTIKANIRIISATNKDLWEETRKGRFREDLYYRLNVLSIKVPPLRERKEDILDILELFLSREGFSMDLISPDAMRCILEYDWPGNVRELENAIRHALALRGGGKIRPDHLPPAVRRKEEGSDVLVLRELEKNAIMKALEKAGGNKTKAAEMLGITRQTLISKLKEYMKG
jgi:DNA-binding NtrC family response regulator